MWLHPERLSPDDHPRAPPCPQMYKDDGLSRGDVEALLKRFANQVPPKPCNGGRSRRAVNLRLRSCRAHSGAARARTGTVVLACPLHARARFGTALPLEHPPPLHRLERTHPLAPEQGLDFFGHLRSSTYDAQIRNWILRLTGATTRTRSASRAGGA